MSLTSEQCIARAKAYEEAAYHLTAGWSHDSLEISEGLIISKSLMDAAKHWYKMAESRARRGR